VTLHRLVERRLPVRLDAVNEETAGTVVIEPATVLVRGPQEVLERARFLPTQPWEMPARFSSSVSASRVSLLQELEGRPVQVVPSRVTVRVPARARKVYELPDVPVHFLCPANFPFQPKFLDERTRYISLHVRGPAREELPQVHTFVDLTQRAFTAGSYHEPVQVQLPKDYELVQDPPRSVSFQLVPIAGVPRGPDSTVPAP
jgi:hypothetical protein